MAIRLNIGDEFEGSTVVHTFFASSTQYVATKSGHFYTIANKEITKTISLEEYTKALIHTNKVSLGENYIRPLKELCGVLRGENEAEFLNIMLSHKDTIMKQATPNTLNSFEGFFGDVEALKEEISRANKFNNKRSRRNSSGISSQF